MSPSEVLVVRIYRRDPSHPERIDGLVQVASSGRTRAFGTLGELTSTVADIVLEYLGEKHAGNPENRPS